MIVIIYSLGVNNAIIAIIYFFFFNIFGEPNRGSFFIICSACAVHVHSVYVG